MFIIEEVYSSHELLFNVFLNALNVIDFFSIHNVFTKPKNNKCKVIHGVSSNNCTHSVAASGNQASVAKQTDQKHKINQRH